MNIRVIKRNTLPDKVLFKGDHILEVTYDDSITSLSRLAVYDTSNNTISQIAPELDNINVIPVSNCIWRSQKDYFSSYRNTEGSEVIDIYVYDAEAQNVRKILSLKEELHDHPENQVIRIFIVHDDQILVQKEFIPESGENGAASGRLSFELTYYNLSTDECFEVKDINLVNNGINTMIPVSENDIMIKTGFPFREDRRIGEQQEDALIEGVYCGSLSMFISSLPHENTSTGAKLIASAYYDKGILNPFVVDDYIVFDLVDYNDNTKETYFYNHTSDETLIFRNDHIGSENVNDSFVIDNTPYMMVPTEKGVAFFNLLSQESDCVFEDEIFSDLKGRLFIFSCKYNGVDHVRMYRYPRLDLVLDEKGLYKTGCCYDDDYYFYISSRSV